MSNHENNPTFSHHLYINGDRFAVPSTQSVSLAQHQGNYVYETTIRYDPTSRDVGVFFDIASFQVLYNGFDTNYRFVSSKYEADYACLARMSTILNALHHSSDANDILAMLVNLTAAYDDSIHATASYSDEAILQQSYTLTKLGTQIALQRDSHSVNALLMASIGDQHVSVAEAKVPIIYGNANDNIILGDEGNNFLVGLAGSDRIDAGAGDDFIVIDADDDLEYIDAGDGVDVVWVTDVRGVKLNLNDLHVEMVHGSSGSDMLVAGGNTSVVIAGGDGDDYILGGTVDDVLSGQAGDDVIDGMNGNDTLYGHRGNDHLKGSLGDDRLDGGLGDDELDGGEGNDILYAGAGNDVLSGGNGYDVVEYSGFCKYYQLAHIENGFVITDQRTAEQDFLYGIERINFFDFELDLTRSDTILLPIDDSLRITNVNETIIIEANQLLANDWNLGNNTLSIAAISNVHGGTARLLNDGNIAFTIDPYFVGLMSFDYSIQNNISHEIVSYSTQNNESVELHARATILSPSEPSDDLYPEQWYLSAIRVQSVWEDYTGSGVQVTIANLDGPFNYQHAELYANVSESVREEIEEVRQHFLGFSIHETEVAGVITGERNHIGIVGVAYHASLAYHGIFNQENGNIIVDQHRLTRYELGDLSHDQIVTNSWHFSDGAFSVNFLHGNERVAGFLIEEVVSNLRHAAMDGRNGLGTVMLQSAGNQRLGGDDTNFSNVINSRYNITVGAYNYFSDPMRGEAAVFPFFSTLGATVLVSAPGSNILTTVIAEPNSEGDEAYFYADNMGYYQMGDYSATAGTSFSTPIVAGIVALMLEANPHLGARDIQAILAYTARLIDSDTVDWVYNSAPDHNLNGLHFSREYGFGCVDAHAAVCLAETWQQQTTYADELSLSATMQGQTVEILDNDTVNSCLTIDTDIKVEYAEALVNIEHERLSDLIIALISPGGTHSTLLWHPGGAPADDLGRTRLQAEVDNMHTLHFNLSSANFYGESGKGQWQLSITDTVTGSVGTLNDWQLTLYGSEQQNDTTYIFTDEFAMDTAEPAVIMDSLGADTINAAALLTDTLIDLRAGAESQINHREVVIASDSCIENAYSGDGDDIIIGNDISNVLSAGRGNNRLTGNAGADCFVIKQHHDNHDIITDFEFNNIAEKIDLSDFKMHDFSELLMHQKRNDTYIEFTNDQQLVLEGVNMSDLSSDNFTFYNDYWVL